MQRFLFFVVLTAAPLFALAGTNVGVAVGVGQPGYYGQIELGGMPAPALIYSNPVIIQAMPAGVVVAPVYLRVPPAHYSNWRRYCGYYHACGRPVYFVTDHWYRNTYVPHHHPPKRYYRDYR